jgi:hypothetical protein
MLVCGEAFRESGPESRYKLFLVFASILPCGILGLRLLVSRLLLTQSGSALPTQVQALTFVTPPLQGSR